MKTFYKRKSVVINVPSGVINAKVGVGSFWWLRGLLGVPEINPDQGLLLKDGHRLHTYGIEYAVDFIYLNIDHQIIHIVEGISAGKFMSFPEAAHMLVLAAGQAQALDLKLEMVLMLS